MKRIFIALALILSFGLLICGSAMAKSKTASLYVSGYATAMCMVNSSSLQFGDYEGAAVSTTGEINVACSKDTPYTITLDAGQNYYNTWRWLADAGGNKIMYHLTKPSGNYEWGDNGYANTYTFGSGVNGTGTGGWDTHVVGGYLYGGYMVPEGWYYDTVAITVHY
jgi:spore coat protein U-like protein